MWLKAVPSFFAHEGAVMDWIGPPIAPALYGWDHGRVHMAEVPGGANHQTRGGELEPMVRLVETLPARVAAIDACGVPDTLVHGDFHPGNVGGEVGSCVLLDWGDSFLGNPLVDELAFTERLAEEDATAARQWFASAWRSIVPSCEPERAAELLRPVLPLLAAVMYARFCAGIEPDERVYHRRDITSMLKRASAEASRA